VNTKQTEKKNSIAIVINYQNKALFLEQQISKVFFFSVVCMVKETCE
jgi:hypothetical protein